MFRALADPTRRALLDALHAEDGQTLVALTALAPGMSRFGVMKHLAVLEDAGLVSTVRDGRSKRHHLNPVPIAEIAERWLHKYAAPYATALLDLRAEAERGTEPPEEKP